MAIGGIPEREIVRMSVAIGSTAAICRPSCFKQNLDVRAHFPPVELLLRTLLKVSPWGRLIVSLVISMDIASVTLLVAPFSGPMAIFGGAFHRPRPRRGHSFNRRAQLQRMHRRHFGHSMPAIVDVDTSRAIELSTAWLKPSNDASNVVARAVRSIALYHGMHVRLCVSVAALCVLQRR